jgi:hypothetical protein
MKKTKFTIIIVILICFNCCKKPKSNQLEKDNLKEELQKEYLDFHFPDTVNIKYEYEGILYYKSSLDTITTDFFSKGDTMRLLTLYLKENKKLITNDFEHILKSKISDTFYSLKDNGEIVFKHKFNKLGINYLEGVLEDEVLLKKSDTAKLRIITNYSHITLPVFVTDKENIIDSFYSKNEKTDK